MSISAESFVRHIEQYHREQLDREAILRNLRHWAQYGPTEAQRERALRELRQMGETL